MDWGVGMSDRPIQVDGSQGEGGGQVLRTSLSLAAITGRPLSIHNIRAGRSRPGLRPQHLTAVRAVAAVCDAELDGDVLGSQRLALRPRGAPRNGDYVFDVTEASAGRSAGAVTLIAQAIIWPLLFAPGASHVTLRGGTFVPFSPPFHYLQHVARPAFARLGASFVAELRAWGWMEGGGGEVRLVVNPIDRLTGVVFAPDDRTVPGSRVEGVAAVTNLPAHIPQRMASRAHNALSESGYTADIKPLRERGQGPGAGIVIWLPGAGFSALGRKGLPADRVADAAVAGFREFVDNSQAAVDQHLADQLLLPMALAHGTSRLTTHNLTRHTFTNVALLRQWLDIAIDISGEPGGPGVITVVGVGLSSGRHSIDV